MKREDYVLDISIADVADMIKERAGKARRVVWTGGEPMLQQKDIYAVMDLLYAEDNSWVCEIETSGTVVPAQVAEPRNYFAQITCSPKLESSGNALSARHKPEAIKGLVATEERRVYIVIKV